MHFGISVRAANEHGRRFLWRLLLIWKFGSRTRWEGEVQKRYWGVDVDRGSVGLKILKMVCNLWRSRRWRGRRRRGEKERRRERENKKLKRGNVEGGMFESWTGSESAPLPCTLSPKLVDFWNLESLWKSEIWTLAHFFGWLDVARNTQHVFLHWLLFRLL